MSDKKNIEENKQTQNREEPLREESTEGQLSSLAEDIQEMLLDSDNYSEDKKEESDESISEFVNVAADSGWIKEEDNHENDDKVGITSDRDQATGVSDSNENKDADEEESSPDAGPENEILYKGYQNGYSSEIEPTMEIASKSVDENIKAEENADKQEMTSESEDLDERDDAEDENLASEPEAFEEEGSTGGWWGDIPFTPLASLDDEEETQPVQIYKHLVNKEPWVDVGITPQSALIVSQEKEETPVTDVLEFDHAGDDIPTVPPPNIPPGWRQENPNLPKNVSEIDRHATRVTPAAYQALKKSSTNQQDTDKTQLKAKKIKKRRAPATKRSIKKNSNKKLGGCLLKAFVFFVFLIILAALAIGSIAIYQYFRISASLPNVNELREHAAQFETTRILDRDGRLLYEILDPNAGRRTYVPLKEISEELIAATIATEDKDFFTNPGFDIWGMTRALFQNYTAGEIRSGASTITQQLARALLLDPTERYEQSYERKAREIVLAFEITRRYSKEEILELYLNENFYGNMAYGVQAASETYFNTSASELNLWQASFLAGLPQGPSIYDIYTNREATLYRQRSVLVLMYELSQERNCIDVGEDRPAVCVSYPEATQAGIDLANYEFPKQSFNIRYPHWVVYVKSLLEEQFDPQTIYKSGFTVYTTLDPGLQDKAEAIINAQLETLTENNATNGALFAMDPQTGEILAMVGSADFYDEDIDGQVNMVLSQTRQPGSAIKPLTFVAAFEKGWTASTLIWDVPTEFPPSSDPFDTNPAYEPVNYDGKFHGPVTLRSALANSYNIPAVKALQFVGIYDDPDTPAEEGLISFANRLGITSLTRKDYGLALTLGGGEVSLKELVGAYAIFANQGRKMPSVAITKITDHAGNTIYEYEPPVGEQVIRAEHAYLISSILSDKSARVPMFGSNPVINLDFTTAVKTGTTNDFRDNWTVGYTPDLVVGAWVGNTDYTPMLNTSGLTGAGPIWAEFMTYAIDEVNDLRPSSFIRPAGIVDRVICAVSGTEPSEWCPEQRSEIFASDQLPLQKSEDLWSQVTIDTWTELVKSDACSEFIDEKFALNVDDEWAKRWIRNDPEGQAWAEETGFSNPLFFVPDRACRSDDPHAMIDLSNLSEGQTINTSPLVIRGIVTATDNFDYFQIEWGEGIKPQKWQTLVEKEHTPQEDQGKLVEWDIEDLDAGIYTLKITIHSTEDTYAERLISLNIQIPTPTPTNTPTSTPTNTPTPTPTNTPTRTPTNTPTEIPTPTPTEKFKEKPSQTQTAIPTRTTTPTPTITFTPDD